MLVGRKFSILLLFLVADASDSCCPETSWSVWLNTLVRNENQGVGWALFSFEGVLMGSSMKTKEPRTMPLPISEVLVPWAVSLPYDISSHNLWEVIVFLMAAVFSFRQLNKFTHFTDGELSLVIVNPIWTLTRCSHCQVCVWFIYFNICQ